MKYVRRQGIILRFIAFLASVSILTQVLPYIFGQTLILPHQIGRDSNLSVNTLEIKPHALNVNEKGSNDDLPNKIIILNFDDSYKSQFTYAKPILDKYGFKTTFFHVCNWIDSGSEENEKMGWNDITELYKEGHDMEAHTMTHPHLDKLSSSELEYEIGQSKHCLLDHGMNSTIFAYPYGEGWDNPDVVNVVSKYFDLARANSETPLTFLNCDDTLDQYTPSQPSCSTYPDNDALVGRYAINSWSHRHIEGDYSTAERRCEGKCTYYNNSQMFEKFVKHVNSQDRYNTNGSIVAIPIVVYHTIVTYPDLTYSKRPVDITVNLFEEEMKYLHNNGFEVLLMSDLVYDDM
ncbi:MAG: polysaccharide deacetylase family protein [Nitrososphaeraceae archaeon]